MILILKIIPDLLRLQYIINVWFFVCVLGLFAILPIFFLSVEHQKLEKRFGIQRGVKIGAFFGRISGWLFFLFWIGVWISPQPRFKITLLGSESALSIINLSIPVFHFIISIPMIALAVWLGIAGVRHLSLKVAETHRPERVIKSGLYSLIRHPQYLAGLIAHLGITFLLSALYSLVFFPLMVIYVYIISRKEEKELVNEFGVEYLAYMEKVPRFVPLLFTRKKFFK